MLHTTHFGNADHYHFIYDLEELRFFYDNILPELAEDEVYFISLSARKKYMNEEERLASKLKGTSEMFERRSIKERNWDIFLRTIRKYEAAEGAYTNSDGTPMDNEKMIVYMNFNPANVVKAYSEFLTNSNANLFDLIMKRGSSLDYFKCLDRKIMTALHHSRGKKHYVDIDIDYVSTEAKGTDNGVNFMNELTLMLDTHMVDYWCIETHGGYHMLLKTSTLEFDYMTEIKKIEAEYKDVIKDIMNNNQGMIPLPGTLQADFEVSVIRGWSSSYISQELMTELTWKGDKPSIKTEDTLVLPLKKSSYGYWYANDSTNPFSIGENSLVAGVPQIIEHVLGPEATEGYFIIKRDPWDGAMQFDRYHPVFKDQAGVVLSKDYEGAWTWYCTLVDDKVLTAGLCPVFKYYFPDQPETLYVKVVDKLESPDVDKPA